MKKAFIIVLILLMCMTGCNSSNSGRTSSNIKNVEDVLKEKTEQSNEQKEPEKQSSDEKKPVNTGLQYGNVDIDLTQLSSTVVYSEVYNMVTNPDEITGKTIRMQGYFATYHDPETDKYYFACIIPDATACCAQGIEFILEGDYKYPDDYPVEGQIITVAGIFDTYAEYYQSGDTTYRQVYSTLRKAVLESVESS